MCKVSDIGGGWTVLLKVVLASYPFLIVWGSWISTAVIRLESFREAGDRFTRSDANKMHRELDARLDALPPKHVGESIRQLQDDVRETKDLLQVFERDFSANFVRKDEL